MARKKVTDESEAKESIYLDADYILDRNKIIVPTTPAVDSILKGGVPEGVLMLITGPEKLGKTSLALTIIRNAQKLGKIGIIADVEHRLRQKILTGINGLDTSTDKLKIIRSTEGNILSGEKFLEYIEQSLHEFPRSVVLIDSFSALSPAVEQDSSYGDKQMAARAALEAKFCRKIAPIIAVNGNIVIGIAHIASNIGMPGTTENVGKKAQYQLDIKVQCKKPYVKEDKIEFEWYNDDELIGHKIKWKCVTNAIGAGGGEAIGYLRYGYGLDERAEAFEQAVDLGIIEVSGSWYVYGDIKRQGWPKMCQYFIENPQALEDIKEEIKKVTDES